MLHFSVTYHCCHPHERANSSCPAISFWVKLCLLRVNSEVNGRFHLQNVLKCIFSLKLQTHTHFSISNECLNAYFNVWIVENCIGISEIWQFVILQIAFYSKRDQIIWWENLQTLKSLNNGVLLLQINWNSYKHTHTSLSIYWSIDWSIYWSIYRSIDRDRIEIE